MKSVTIHSRRDGQLVAMVHAAWGWDDFESVVRFLKRDYGAKVTRQLDGPDARKAWLLATGIPVEIEYHDTAGTSIIAPDAAASDLVRTIAEDIRARFDEIGDDSAS